MELKHYELHVKKHLREWRVTYTGGLANMIHASSYGRSAEWVFKRIKREFGREVVDALMSKMIAQGGEWVYEERLNELAWCYLNVMRVFKEFYPDYEVERGISIQRFISRLEMMHPDGVPYLISVLYPENGLLMRFAGTFMTTELHRMQDWRIRLSVHVQLLRDKGQQVPQHTNNPDGATIPADGARISFSRVCEVGDETIWPVLNARGAQFIEHENLPAIMEDI